MGELYLLSFCVVVGSGWLMVRNRGTLNLRIILVVGDSCSRNTNSSSSAILLGLSVNMAYSERCLCRR